MELITRGPDTVKSRGDFVAFVQTPLDDLLNSPEGWENPNLERFLDALAVWIDDSERTWKRAGKPEPQAENWAFFAKALAAARNYE